MSDGAGQGLSGWAATLENLYGNDAKDAMIVYRVLLSCVTEHRTAALQRGQLRDEMAAIEYTAACQAVGVKANKRIAEACAKHSKEIDVSSEYIGVRGYLAFFVVLPSLPYLETLKMPRSRMDTTLVVLLSHSCGYGRRMGKDLPSLVPSSLARLDLSNNPFGSVGAQALAELVGKRSSLVEITLEGVEMIAAVHTKLQKSLSRNKAALLEAAKKEQLCEEEEQHATVGTLPVNEVS